MILNNVACGFIAGSRAAKGNMGRKLAGLCGTSILLDISSLSSIHSSKPSVSIWWPRIFLQSRTLFPPSKLTSRVFNW